MKAGPPPGRTAAETAEAKNMKPLYFSAVDNVQYCPVEYELMRSRLLYCIFAGWLN